MTNTKRIIGKSGLSILEIKPSPTPKKKKTPDEIAKWCAALPMADTGAAAKKLFILLTELSETVMTAKERYAVMELLRTPNKVICTALKRHYIEQRAPLTEHKIIIANLRQTLLTLMADNYKLILEDLYNTDLKHEADKVFMATIIVRIYYYLNVFLISRYQLYNYSPPNIWHEIYLLYKYAKSQGLLEIRVPCQFSPNKQTSVLEAYMRIILMYAIDPYQWRQREQHSLNKAIEMWALYATIYDHNHIPDKKAGIYIIDLDQDAPPTLYSFRDAPITASCIAIDLAKSVEHLKVILEKLRSDHLKAKIENPNDPEFIVTAPTIAKLVNFWSKHITRSSPRFPIQAQIQIVFGLTAAHYYVNDEKEFNPHPSNLRTTFGEPGAAMQAATNKLPLYEVLEEEEEEAKVPLSSSEAEANKTEAEVIEVVEAGISKEQLYHIYTYNIENINPHGFCIVIRDNTYPPFQAGEVVAFKNMSQGSTIWGIGAVRWLRRQPNEDFQIGIQIIAPYAKAAGIQMIRADKPASRLLRCLVLPEDKEAKTPPMLITTAFPIHSNTVMLYTDTPEPIKATLTKEIDASGMYYQYVYTSAENIDILGPKKPDTTKTTTEIEEDKTNTEFDSIWGDL